jgi:AcrR family transcriptional regulator
MSVPGDYIYDGRLRKGARRRAEILERAVDIASVEGLSNLTIGRLATDLGMSKGNLNQLLGDKQAIQLATLEAAMSRFEREIIATASRRQAQISRLAALSAAWFRHVERRVFPGGCFLHATASEYRARRGPIRDAIRRHRKSWHERLAAAFREAQRQRQVRAEVDVRDLIVELVSYQATAHVAAMLGDRDTFRRARRAAERCIRDSSLTRRRRR